MGFSITKEFPSRFLCGDEVAGKNIDVVIREVKKEKARSPKTNQEEPVLVIYFEGKDRGICLGKERAKELRSILSSDDTDDWKGKTVNIFTRKKYAFGKQNNVLHFRKSGTANIEVSDDEEEQLILDQSELSKELDSIAIQ